MALTKETASKIVNIVAVDASCRKAIQPHPELDAISPIGSALLEFTHTAGSLRNIAMLFAGKGPGDDTFDERICLGIAMVTANAIRRANLPEIRAVATSHREHWGVHHEATWLRMTDESQYMFDWHATLKVNDPVISKFDDWHKAQNAVNYVLFKGFN